MIYKAAVKRREERKKDKKNNVDDDIVKLAFLRLSWHQFEWSELYIKQSSIFISPKKLMKPLSSFFFISSWVPSAYPQILSI